MMYVYMSKKRDYQGNLSPIVVESNLVYAIPYWTARQRLNRKLFWEIK